MFGGPNYNLILPALRPLAWRLCCCGLPSFDGKGSGAPPFAQGGALGFFAVGARLRRDARNNACYQALIKLATELFPLPTDPQVFYRGVALVLIRAWLLTFSRFRLQPAGQSMLMYSGRWSVARSWTDFRDKRHDHKSL